MGTHPATDYSHIFMVKKIEKYIWYISEKIKEDMESETDMLLMLKKFLDDIFAIKYDPRLPSIQTIQAKQSRFMTKLNQYLAECFPEPPLTAFRRPKNLRERLIKA